MADSGKQVHPRLIVVMLRRVIHVVVATFQFVVCAYGLKSAWKAWRHAASVIGISSRVAELQYATRANLWDAATQLGASRPLLQSALVALAGVLLCEFIKTHRRYAIQMIIMLPTKLQYAIGWLGIVFSATHILHALGGLVSIYATEDVDPWSVAYVNLDIRAHLDTIASLDGAVPDFDQTKRMSTSVWLQFAGVDAGIVAFVACLLTALFAIAVINVGASIIVFRTKSRTA